MNKLLYLFLFLPLWVQAQEFGDVDIKQIHITRASQAPSIDGQLNDPVWLSKTPAKDFWVQNPRDDIQAEHQTEVMLVYDDQFIYVAATLYGPNEYVIQTLKRDNFGEDDAFAVFFDPVREKTNGFGFGVSALGVQSEALMLYNDGDPSWDNRWVSAVQNYADRWTLEMAIPFKSLRYEANKQVWGINFMRIHPQKNEEHVWSRTPVQFAAFDLGYYGELVWDIPPGKSGPNISLIPYVSGAYNEERVTEDSLFQDPRLNVGGDAKIAITPALNLDLTVNPDFSQVEVDQQVTNLTRFNIFFPERRNFFLENADIFNNFGSFPEQPFFSRSIGLAPDGSTIPILFGARLSGNLDENWRVGLLNMQTKGDTSQYGQNYSAATFQRRIGKRSVIKGMFLNRQAFDGTEMVDADYGRNAALEGFYSSNDGKWQGWGGYIHSFADGIRSKNQHIHGGFAYNGKQFRTFTRIQHMGEQYRADMGFIGRLFNYNPETKEFERLAFTQIANNIDYYIFTEESPRLNFHWSGLENYVYINPDGSLNEWYTRLRHFLFFKNTSELRFRLNNNYVDLRFPFSLTDGDPLPAGAYNFTEFNIQYNSDQRKLFNYNIFAVYGSFYNGTKLTLDVGVSYRIQPWANFTLGVEMNDIQFPDPYGSARLWLINPRIEINFSKNLFWTTFVQYNTQAENLNINSRLQWRYAPMSDVFLIYTDNYEVADILGRKTRSIVLKVNYWLTL